MCSKAYMNGSYKSKAKAVYIMIKSNVKYRKNIVYWSVRVAAKIDKNFTRWMAL